MTKKRLLALVLGAVVALSAAQPAMAKGVRNGGGRHNGARRGNSDVGPGPNANFRGLLTDVNGDSKSSTEGPFVVEVDHASGPQASRPSGEVSVRILPTTEFHGERRQGRRLSDYRVGDFVSIQAHRATNGQLTARTVKMQLQHYRGTLSSYDDSKGVLEAKEIDNAAAAWLSAHGDASKVSFVNTDSTKIVGDPAEGGNAELTARPSADGKTLEAIKLKEGPAAADEGSSSTSI